MSGARSGDPRAGGGRGGTSGEPSGLAERLRLIVITDRRIAAGAGHTSIVDVVRAAVAAGATSIQLRDKDASARELAEQGRALLEITRPAGALLFVNDRVDVALAVGADGVHVGPDDLPVGGVRRGWGGAGGGGGGGTRGVGPGGSGPAQRFLIGTSTDDPEEARRLVAEGADYLGCGTVYATSSKPDAGSVIGVEGLAAVVEAVEAPVVGIGGVTAERAAEIRTHTAAAGVAVIGAVMGARDVGTAVRRLLTASSAPF